MKREAFLSALILNATILATEVKLPVPTVKPRKMEWDPTNKEPRRPRDASYMRGWRAVGSALGRR